MKKSETAFKTWKNVDRRGKSIYAERGRSIYAKMEKDGKRCTRVERDIYANAEKAYKERHI